MRRVVPILLLTVLVIPALAVGRVTLDPNKPGVSAEASADLRTDARLAQKVNYSAAKKSVSTIIDDLAKATGVTIKAGRNSGDWQVRDRKMNIYAKDVPLNQLMNSMARVMKFKWEISGKPGDWSYRLFMDRKSLLDAEAQRVREEQKAEEKQAMKRQKGLLQYGQLGNLTPQEKAKLKTDNPFMYFVASSGMGNSFGSFFSESPGALEAIATGQEFQFSAGSLSPAAQAGLLKGMQQMLLMESKFSDGKSNPSLPADLESTLGSVDIRINHNLEMMKGSGRAGMLLGEMEFRYEGGSVNVPMLDPDSVMTKMIGKALVMSDEQGRPLDQVMREIGPEFMAAAMKEVKAEAGGEPVNEHADDPALHEKITLKPEGKALSDVEKALAEATKLAVVSDFFGGWNAPIISVPTGESELKEVLEKIGDNYTYNWDRHSGVIELRDRNWFKKRAAQIPEAWLERWRQEFTTTGTMDIDTLSQIAVLTQEQIKVNLASDDVLYPVIATVYTSREYLRLYACLSADQRAALFTPRGLDLRSLSQDQWAQAQRSWRTSDELKREESIAATREQKDKVCEYMFSRIDSNGENLGARPVFTPIYTPPAEKKPSQKPGDTAKSADQKPAEAAKPK